MPPESRSKWSTNLEAAVGTEAAHYKPFDSHAGPRNHTRIADRRTYLSMSIELDKPVRARLRVSAPSGFRRARRNGADSVLSFFGVVHGGLAEVIVHQRPRLFGVALANGEIDSPMHVRCVAEVSVGRPRCRRPSMFEKERRDHFD